MAAETPSTHPGNRFVDCAAAHRGRVEGEADDVSHALKWSILGNDKQLVAVVNDLVNSSVICSEKKGGGVGWGGAGDAMLTHHASQLFCALR